MKILDPKLLQSAPIYHGLLDSHIHLDSKAYQSDLEQCLSNAARVGVEGMLLPSTNLQSSLEIARLMQVHGQLRGGLGIHPHDAASFDPETSPQTMQSLLQKHPWSAIGETGLELHYDFCPLPTQIASLEAHLELARQSQLPIILHCRLAEEPLHELLVSRGHGIRGVVHCFTGGWQWAKKFLDLGFLLGIGGLVTLPKATDVHEVALKVPADRWLLETDGPYLSPVPFRGTRNESALLPWVVQRIAELRQEPPQQLVDQARENAHQLFAWNSRSRVEVIP